MLKLIHQHLFLMILTSALLFSESTLLATNYVFNGSGNWSNPANWDVNGYPGTSVGTGNTVTIGGDCAIDVDVDVTCDFTTNISGTLTINSSQTLTVNSGGGNFLLQTNYTFTINGTLQVDGNGQINNASDVDINNNGVFAIGGGTFTNLGDIDFVLGSSFSIAAGATFNHNAGGTSSILYATNDPMSIAGDFVINDDIQLNNASIVNIATTGSMTLAGGTFTGFGQINNEGTVTVNSGQTMSLTGAGQTLTNKSTGTIKGEGTISKVTNEASGNIEPGASPVCLAINVLDNSGDILIEAEGTTACTEYDQISGTGTATLGGTLTLTIGGGYTPADNDQLTIIDANALSGTFSSVSLPADWSIAYDSPNAGEVTLTYTAPPANFVYSGTGNWTDAGNWAPYYPGTSVGTGNTSPPRPPLRQRAPLARCCRELV